MTGGAAPERPLPRACPVCAARTSRPHAATRGAHFQRCDTCACLHLAEAPDWDALDALYQADYGAARGHGSDRAIDGAKAATARDYLALLERHGAPGRRYLEVGCSAGAALAEAAAAGWQAEGIELSAPAAALARQRPRVDAVHTGTLLDVDLERRFDVIAMFDVLEHIDPPRPTIRRAHDLLAPGGLLLIVTPDAGSLSARLLGRRWPHLLPEHVICFSRGALRQLLSDAGFEVVGIGFAWKRVNLEMLVRHAELHRDAFGGGLLRALARLVPRALRQAQIPFNLGELYAVARRPSA